MKLAQNKRRRRKLCERSHEAHASLIQKEACGEKTVPTILLMHAEDQLMNAETTKIMAEEIIKLSQRIKKLEGGE